MATFTVTMSSIAWVDAGEILNPGDQRVIIMRGGGYIGPPNFGPTATRPVTPYGSTPQENLAGTNEPYGFWAALRNEPKGLVWAYGLVYVARNVALAAPDRPLDDTSYPENAGLPGSDSPILYTCPPGPQRRLLFQFNGTGNSFYRDGYHGEFTVSVYPVQIAAPVLSGETVLDPEACAVSAHLTWTAIENAESYSVYRDGELLIDELTDTKFFDLTVLIGNSYSYSVRAVWPYSTSAHSNTVTVSPDVSLPPPVITACQPCCERVVRVKWDAVTQATGYEIFRNGESCAVVNPDTFRYLDTSVDVGSTYEYTVVALVGCWESGESNIARVTVCGWQGVPEPTCNWQTPAYPVSGWITAPDTCEASSVGCTCED